MFDNLKNRLDSESFVSLVLGIAVVLLLGSLIFNYFSGKKIAGQGAATQTEKQTEETAQTPPTTHVVTLGETLWSISEKYYQSGYNWVDLAKTNQLVNANHIEVGQNLTIPVVTPIVMKTEVSGGQISAAEVTAKPTPANYTVVHGDSLWSISLVHYGTGYRWPDIAKANHLANPGLIHAGNVFILP